MLSLSVVLESLRGEKLDEKAESNLNSCRYIKILKHLRHIAKLISGLIIQNSKYFKTHQILTWLILESEHTWRHVMKEKEI